MHIVETALCILNPLFPQASDMKVQHSLVTLDSNPQLRQQCDREGE